MGVAQPRLDQPDDRPMAARSRDRQLLNVPEDAAHLERKHDKGVAKGNVAEFPDEGPLDHDIDRTRKVLQIRCRYDP
jgi:hypothetical protein